MAKPKTAKKAAPARRKPPAKEPDGDAAVQAYIAALPDWKKALAKRIDALIEREVPDVRRAIKWGMPFYGIEGQGWFLRLAAYSKHLNLRFTRGTSLKPMPPAGEPGFEPRGLHLKEDDWMRSNSRPGSARLPRFPASLDESLPGATLDSAVTARARHGKR